MILPDTSIWVDYLNVGDAELAGLLVDGRVLVHPYVVGEIMLGSMKARAAVAAFFEDMNVAVVAEHHEVLGLIERRGLFGSGIGYVDAHLLASTCLTEETKLWTRDKRLAAAAANLGISYGLPN